LGETRECLLTAVSTGTNFNYQVYFNELATTATGVSTDPTPMETRLLALIDGAVSGIDMALYGLDRQSVIDALVAADQRGVAVRVVGDDDAAVDYSTAYQQLIDADIPLVTDAPSSYIQHNKFLVVDSQVVWTGSTNFTDTGFSLNANNSLVITDTLIASVYTLEFEEMWSGLFHKDKGDNSAHLLDYNDILVGSFFSPTDLVAFEAWDALAEADVSIHFAMFYWTDPLLADRAIERINDGVAVRGIWDQVGAANVASQDEKLCQAGAVIGTEDLPGKVHHKFAVIDVDGSDPTVILGSYNWTESGAYENDENTLIIHDAVLAQAYYQEWQRLWATLEPERICNAPAVFLPLVEK
jgi:phosphatidylserine/phosphatidylglycerophosphate/cardiolipin synthase-like enzyme